MSIQLHPGDPHDDALLAQVHPVDWVNPPPKDRYDLVVIGGGPAGLVAAAGAAGLGAKVALVERELLGGDCLNAGCVPSKTLLRAARAVAQAKDAARFGVHVDGMRVDFAEVMRRVRAVRAEISPHDSAARFRGLGIDIFFGQGRFAGANVVEVAGQSLRFRKAIIAAGARALHPNIAGLAKDDLLTNENLFALTELPKRLAIIGAGPIGCEMAQAFARLGAKVTLLDVLPRILSREEPSAADLVEKSLRRDGVELILEATVTRVESKNHERILHWVGGGRKESLFVDAILVGAGRVPNVDALNLEAAGVAYTTEGITVSDQLRTTNRSIYAAGDIASRFKFTHAADALARIAIQNALCLGRAKASTLRIPWCTYTDPEIAHVGLYEQEAVAQGLTHRVFVQDFADVDRAVVDGETDGFVRLIADPQGRILGATIASSHAGEMISEVALAMTANIRLGGLARVIHPYPTEAEALKKIADAFNRGRLTPWVKWLLERWLRW